MSRIRAAFHDPEGSRHGLPTYVTAGTAELDLATSSSLWRIERHGPMFCGSSCTQTISRTLG